MVGQITKEQAKQIMQQGKLFNSMDATFHGKIGIFQSSLDVIGLNRHAIDQITADHSIVITGIDTMHLNPGGGMLAKDETAMMFYLSQLEEIAGMSYDTAQTQKPAAARPAVTRDKV